MGDMQSTKATIDHDDYIPSERLDLGHLPSVYVLSAHLTTDEQHEIEDMLSSAGALLTYSITEASLIFSNISTARRAKAELQWKGVRVKDVDYAAPRKGSASPSDSSNPTPAKKRRRLGKAMGSQSTFESSITGSTTASETEDENDANTKPMSQLSLSQVSTVGSSDITLEGRVTQPSPELMSFAGKVKVIKIEWLRESLSATRLLPFGPYTIYEAEILPPEAVVVNLPSAHKPVGSIPMNTRADTIPPSVQKFSHGIIDRANTDQKPTVKRQRKYDRIKAAADQDILGKSFSSSTQFNSQISKQPLTRPSHLLHQTTSEHEEAVSSSLPPMPDWVKQNKIYACERATPLESTNKDFICQLKKIKLARILTLDEIGVRAYSSSIAAIAAYPYEMQSSREVLALPGCDQKIAHLFHEWQSSNGLIRAVTDLEADPALTALREFYEIWGVGAKTAREFYYDKGWRDLDDIVEFGWKSLSRVQQIGLKYYEEFLLKISRSEVEAITAVITRHAKLVTDANVESVIVGGYRRGKPESGDVDVILSHRENAMTKNLVDRVIKSLEKEGWITHTLTLNLTNTKRDQEPLPINTATQVGHGFDTLDKALIVWQDPHWPTKDTDLAANVKAKNPNPHRRVDIIISPWRTVGCAIAGWTSGTTFQRDLRRYAKHVKGWKFDSSGVRERGTGRWIDLEGWSDPETRCRDWKEAERRVFEGMGLVYREPWDRCTG